MAVKLNNKLDDKLSKLRTRSVNTVNDLEMVINFLGVIKQDIENTINTSFWEMGTLSSFQETLENQLNEVGAMRKQTLDALIEIEEGNVSED